MIRTPVRSSAEAEQAALLTVTGDYVAFVDHDDLITHNALPEVVALLREDPTIDYVYTDHAMADRDGWPTSVSSKPEWSPDFLLSTNYIVHFKVVRRSLLLSVGGLAQEVSDVQDLGMSWRLVEANARIAHLPKPVHLWREHENSVAATTEAKPGIEKLLVNVYDRHLGHVGVSASQTWPQPFRQRRIGVFRLDFQKIVLPTSIVVFVKSDVERTAEIRARIGRGTSNRIDFPQRSSMSPIPGVPFSDFLEMFKISLEEMLLEIRSGRLVITIQTDTRHEGNKFITPAQFHAWVNNSSDSCEFAEPGHGSRQNQNELSVVLIISSARHGFPAF